MPSGTGTSRSAPDLPCRALPIPWVASPALPVRVVTEAVQRRHVAVRHQPHIAAPAAVTAVGTTLGHVGLTSKRDRAGPTVPRFDVYLGFVDEGRHTGPDPRPA